MSESDFIHINVSTSKIEAIRKLGLNWREIPAVYIVNMALDLWIEQTKDWNDLVSMNQDVSKALKEAKKE